MVPGENEMMGMLSRVVTTVIWQDLFEIKYRIKKNIHGFRSVNGNIYSVFEKKTVPL